MIFLNASTAAPKLFGWQHLVYLAAFAVVSVGGILLFYFKAKGKPRIEDLAVKITGGVLLALVLWNRIAIGLHYDNMLRAIPDSLCAVCNIGLGICAIVCKRGALPLHYFCYNAMMGGVFNVFMPNYLGQSDSLMYPATISGLLHHAVALDLAIVMLVSGHFRPSVKKFYAYPVGLCFTLVWGIFLLDALGAASVGDIGFTTAMNIYAPLIAGTPLTWYIVLPAEALLFFGVAIVYEKIRRRIKQTSVN